MSLVTASEQDKGQVGRIKGFRRKDRESVLEFIPVQWLY